MSMWHNKMFSKNNVYASEFPICIFYADSQSVGGDSHNDLDISFKNKVVGSGKKLSKGDGVLVVSKNVGSDEFQIFCGVVKERVDDTGFWNHSGGKIWENCYSIELHSSPAMLHSAILEVVTGFNKVSISTLYSFYKRGKMVNKASLSAIAAIFNYVQQMHPLK